MTEGHTGTGILWLVKPEGGIGSVAQDLQPFACGVVVQNLNTGGTSGVKSHRRARLFSKNTLEVFNMSKKQATTVKAIGIKPTGENKLSHQ